MLSAHDSHQSLAVDCMPRVRRISRVRKPRSISSPPAVHARSLRMLIATSRVLSSDHVGRLPARTTMGSSDSGAHRRSSLQEQKKNAESVGCRDCIQRNWPWERKGEAAQQTSRAYIKEESGPVEAMYLGSQPPNTGPTR